MYLRDRYYILNYLKSSKNINDLLLTDAGIPLDLANLIISDDYLEIKVETEKLHFNTIRDHLIKIIESIEIKEIDTSSCI